MLRLLLEIAAQGKVELRHGITTTQCTFRPLPAWWHLF